MLLLAVHVLAGNFLAGNVLAVNRPLPLSIVSKVCSALHTVSKRVFYTLYGVIHTLSVLLEVQMGLMVLHVWAADIQNESFKVEVRVLLFLFLDALICLSPEEANAIN